MSTPSCRLMLKRVMSGSVMGKTPVLRRSRKIGDDRAAAAHDVAVAHDRETDVAIAADVVGGGEQLVGAELCGAVEIDGRGGLVRGQRHDAPYAGCPDIASMTFCAPRMLVLMNSKGLYSAAGTCLSAAAWMTVSMPSKARCSRL